MSRPPAWFRRQEGWTQNMKSRAVLFLVLAAVLWSLGGILIKLVAWNPIAIAGTRSAIAALVMLAFPAQNAL